ncbi:hypothetical protein EJ02DRAFT_425993 [Clathrospora elynae]|uniref:Uncharacterized protein n=1 Tax=Clathrospora elynae TaxID=706981 RepID=A0A6A5SHY3_9PLEO|nr:hypothetical protein EJ02DRAFT_425993 [Clathrospora elynae]
MSISTQEGTILALSIFTSVFMTEWLRVANNAHARVHQSIDALVEELEDTKQKLEQEQTATKSLRQRVKQLHRINELTEGANNHLHNEVSDLELQLYQARMKNRKATKKFEEFRGHWNGIADLFDTEIKKEKCDCGGCETEGEDSD